MLIDNSIVVPQQGKIYRPAVLSIDETYFCGLFLLVRLVFFAVLFVFLGSESSGNFVVEGASSDLSCFNSSSLPHVLEMMASSWGTSALSFAVRSSYWAMMRGIIF